MITMAARDGVLKSYLESSPKYFCISKLAKIFVSDPIPNWVLVVIGCFVPRSLTPKACDVTTCPSFTTTTTIPGLVPWRQFVKADLKVCWILDLVWFCPVTAMATKETPSTQRTILMLFMCVPLKNFLTLLFIDIRGSMRKTAYLAYLRHIFRITHSGVEVLSI